MFDAVHGGWMTRIIVKVPVFQCDVMHLSILAWPLFGLC